MTSGVAAFEEAVPERLQAEPSVFGGATGSEVLVEILQRLVAPEEALKRLGGSETRLRAADHYSLLEECALSEAGLETLHQSLLMPLGEALTTAPDLEFPCVLYALVRLDVLKAERHAPKAEQRKLAKRDVLDEQAIRLAIASRRALVDDGDYFALLGVSRGATGYDIRRAYLELRGKLDPSVVLTSATLDLRDDVQLILEVLREAYEILKDAPKRERYRRAIESVPA
jgi:hypothetical protein